MFHLVNLIRLDMTSVGEDAKAFSESTFMKKRMYYNMRIKTIQRNTSNIMKLLKICKRLRINKIDMQTSKLTKKLQEIQREIEERIHIASENKTQF
jgi:phosphoglycerate-specific signal transduction histidine kinase